MYKKIFYSLFFSVVTLLSTHGFARTHSLTIVDDGISTQVSIDEIRKQSHLEFSIYEPFKEKKVQMKGIYLDDLLIRYLSKVPQNITLYALDGYQTKFHAWKKRHWVIVTYEDSKALNLRSKGPLKVVETDISGKDPKNLRDFNDWVWMLNKIEVAE